jgi:predicted nucleotide-binding protein
LRVFISHSFNDPSLAATLVALLKEEDIIGYMAQRVKEYKLLIIDKIKKEISESDYLVAIITNAGIFSPWSMKK